MRNYLLTACLVALPLTANSAVIYSQTPTPNGGINSDADQPAFTADDFTLYSNDTIRSITWRGFYLINNSGSLPPDTGTPPLVNDFTINIFSSPQGGSSLVASYHLGDAVDYFDTGIEYVDPINYFEFSADLGSGISLASGQYWLSIYNSTPTDTDNFFWAIEKNTGNSWSAIGINDPLFFNGETGHSTYFVLDNSNLNNVPIPSAVWLFGSGLIGLIGLARRKANA